MNVPDILHQFVSLDLESIKKSRFLVAFNFETKNRLGFMTAVSSISTLFLFARDASINWASHAWEYPVPPMQYGGSFDMQALLDRFDANDDTLTDLSKALIDNVRATDNSELEVPFCTITLVPTCSIELPSWLFLGYLLDIALPTPFAEAFANIKADVDPETRPAAAIVVDGSVNDHFNHCRFFPSCVERFVIPNAQTVR